MIVDWNISCNSILCVDDSSNGLLVYLLCIFLTGLQQRQIQSIVTVNFTQIPNRGILVIMEQEPKRSFWKTFPHWNLWGKFPIDFEEKTDDLCWKVYHKIYLPDKFLHLWEECIFIACISFVLLYNSVIKGKRPKINV